MALTLTGELKLVELVPELNRRFEAVVLAGGPVVEAVGTGVIDGLRRLGMEVAQTVAVAGAGDEVVRIVADLERQGIGRRGVLVLATGLGPARDDWDPLLVPELDGATIVAADQALSGTTPGVIRLAAGPVAARMVLADQTARRRRAEPPEADLDPNWTVVVEGLDPLRERVDESILALADGSIGVTGAPLFHGASCRTSALAAGVYDGEGPDTQLLAVPAPFHFHVDLADEPRIRRSLDLRTGVLFEEAGGGGRGAVRSARFLAITRPGTAVLRAAGPSQLLAGSPLLAPDEHPVLESGDGAIPWSRTAASNGGGASAAALEVRHPGDGQLSVDRFVGYETSPAQLPDRSEAVAKAQAAADLGFESMLAEQRRAWASRWESAGIVVEGDDELTRAARFSMFHLMASVAESGEAAVGARALSGPGYRGHVFWDADTFVLPFLAASHPASARAMIEYRLRRLPAAMAAAQSAGRAGARFPWESAATGEDVTPLSARDRTGRLVRIRTGQLEEHIVGQVAWAACCYADWTGDDEFARGPLRRLLVETARYWASRIRMEADGTAHMYGVIGPDEYHEPVDDNAFTNVLARWNLRRAAAAVESGAGAGVAGVAGEERWNWLRLAEALYDGYDPDTGVYEQFAGFHDLEPLVIEEIAPRRPIAADLLLGAERVRGAQVLKQADVLMLHHLVPDEVAAGSLEPNLRFYEPRTAHGSSLSPAVHASLLARARDFDRALKALRIASRIDLDDLTGSTASGLHVATMGGLWQALVFGFGGLRPRMGALEVDPRVPRSWSVVDVRVLFRGSRLRCRAERGRLSITADPPVGVFVEGAPFTAGPRGLEFRRKGPRWELT